MNLKFRFLKKNSAWVGTFLFLFILFILLHSKLFKDESCSVLKRYRRINLNGILTNKFIDSSEHSYPILVINNFDSTVETINLVFDITNLFSVVDIGDSIFKKRNETWLEIKNNNKHFKRNIDFGCSDK
jgi:hypothetical protein